MKSDYLFLIYLAVAYLIGAIPTSIWVGKIFFKKDIRSMGSGNAGATNTYRAFGKTTAIIVLFIDISKGWSAVMLPYLLNRWLSVPLPVTYYIEYPEIILGLTAALGHVYPIYEKFKGGKGVATLFGAIIGMDYQIATICIVVFMLSFIFSRKISLSSMIAAITFTIAFLIFHAPYRIIDTLAIYMLPLLVIYTHRSNIKRLLKGEEPDFKFKKNKS
ncbi:MAG: glycerol-3-phosphate 1-O-acyltransferase PlsY [Candidatus Kuenenia stuttgartiensis]|nr:glycerol-3-phosphate 1-O-acyltransferase PlsY [Candidatus Kuenenia stuttgartiensis]